MPISFAPGGAHYDVTPLENLFIENYMAEANGEFVKVYVYGLMFCYRQEEQPQEYADIARDLRLNEDTVRAAFAYWEKLQLVHVVSQKPLAIEFMNLKQQVLSGSKAQEREKDKVFDELVREINNIFRDKRVITPSEFNMAFDWYEILHFEKLAIPMIINYCIGEKGDKLSFKYIDSVAQDWSGKGITSSDEVELQLKMLEARKSGATKVLARWSLRRAPTVDEILLYRKWTEEWGFDDGAIMAVIPESTGSSNPNFKYLDSILQSYYDTGATTSRLVKDETERRKRMKEICGDIAKALGMRPSVSNSNELANIYSHFTSMGFTDSSILLAARMLCLENRSTLADLQARLNKWQEDGTVTDDAMAFRNEKDSEAAQAVKYWLEIWGQSRAPAPGELAAYARFTGEWGFKQDLVNFAAERSAFAEKPLAMMGKLMSQWKEKGVTDRRAAEAEWERARPSGSSREDFSDRNFQNQNTYTKEQFDGMKTGVFDLKDL